VKRSVCVQLLVTASLLAPLGACSERGNSGAAAAAGVGSDVADDGFDPNQSYAPNAYFPRLGYYHPAAHWFFPYAVNFYRLGQGYFNGGTWSPLAQPLGLPSRPDASRAFAYLAAHRRRRSGGSGYYGGFSHGIFGGGGGGIGESHGVSRGGFGASGHGSGGA
jgi:hypothetical protein